MATSPPPQNLRARALVTPGLLTPSLIAVSPAHVCSLVHSLVCEESSRLCPNGPCTPHSVLTPRILQEGARCQFTMSLKHKPQVSAPSDFLIAPFLWREVGGGVPLTPHGASNPLEGSALTPGAPSSFQQRVEEGWKAIGWLSLLSPEIQPQHLIAHSGSQHRSPSLVPQLKFPLQSSVQF